jgi:hypothetical protein
MYLNAVGHDQLLVDAQLQIVGAVNGLVACLPVTVLIQNGRSFELDIFRSIGVLATVVTKSIPYKYICTRIP